jgi:hypothetical protein
MTVGIATGYGLDDQWVGVRVPVGKRIFSLHVVQTGSGVHPTSYPKVTGGSFHRGKAVGAWSWPLTSNYCWGQENVDLYIHFPIRLHGVVLNLLSTRKNLPFTYLLEYNAVYFVESQPAVWRNMSPPAPALLATCFMLVSCLAYSSALKIEPTCFSYKSVDFQWTTWHYMPEDRTHHNHGCENLNSCISSRRLLRTEINRPQ